MRRRLLSLLIAAAVGLFSLAGGRAITHSAAPAQGMGPTMATTYHVVVGYGDDDFAATIYNPSILRVYVGDTVTWTVHGILEPHTVTFGPVAMLKRLSDNAVQVHPQMHAPPVLVLSPTIALPTRSPTYNGMGYANSGFLTAGKSWSLTFTRPGIYTYYCLIHFPGMKGTVVVEPRPAMAHTYSVSAGYFNDASQVDAFFPEVLTVHVGDTVVWRNAIFHTVTFGPPAWIQQVRRQFIVPMPQKNGPPELTVNAKTAFPIGGHTVNGMGIVSSGILQPPHNTYTLTFTKPGTYHYGCLVHPGMDGTIIVLP